MIRFNNVTKYFEHKGNLKYVLEKASCEIPSKGNAVIIGKEGSGKSVLIKLIAGSLFCDRGSIESDEKISWPVGFKGQLINNISVHENVEFIAMLMHSSKQKRNEIKDFILDFTGMDKFEMPVKALTKTMRNKLYFALCFAFKFDTYLIDDIHLDEDPALRSKVYKFFNENPSCRYIFATNDVDEIKRCQIGIIIKDQKLILCENNKQVVEEYENMFSVTSEISTSVR